MPSSIFELPLSLERNAPCFCASGERFKRCCGAVDGQRRVPHGIELTERFLDPETCRRWVALLEQQPRAPLDVVDHQQSSAAEIRRQYHPDRITDRVDAGALQPEIEALVRRAFVDVVAPRWACQFAWFERPVVLRYGVGGQYAVHADSELWSESRDPYRVLDRDGSLLIYLNDEFTGGDLHFVNFEYLLRPRPGLMVAFPSDERYAHGAQPTTSGVRYAIVSWAYAQGRPRVRELPPAEHIDLMQVREQPPGNSTATETQHTSDGR